VGNRGPAPTPTVIRKAEGNPGKRPFNDREPQPRAIRPKMPKHLDPRAKKEWKRLCPMLERLHVLTEADGIALANLVNVFNPEMIVIGGGVSAAWELFAGCARAEVMKRAFSVPAQRCQIVRAACGDDAGLLGAAWLAFDRARNDIKAISL